MSDKKVVLKKYLESRLGESYILLQQHLESKKEICVIKKKGSNNIDPQFMSAVQEQASGAKVRLDSSDSGLRLEADTEDHFNFLFKC